MAKGRSLPFILLAILWPPGQAGTTLRADEPLTLTAAAGKATSPFNRVAFSPDSKRLVIGGPHWTLVIWDAATGKEVLRTPADTEEMPGPFHGLAISPDGRRLASAEERLVKLWDATSGREVLRLAVDYPLGPPCLAFHPGGRYLACPNRDQAVQVWDLADSKPVRTLRRSRPGKNVRDCVCDLSYRPDGNFLAAADTTTGFVTVWDAASGKVVHLLDVRGEGGGFWDMGFAPCKVVFSPDGRRLATTGGAWDPVKVWDAASGRLLHRLEGGLAFAFSPDGRHIATVTPESGVSRAGGPVETKGGEIKVWEAATGREVGSVKSRSGPNICGLTFSPDGKRLAVVNQEYTAKVWEVSRLMKRAPRD